MKMNSPCQISKPNFSTPKAAWKGMLWGVRAKDDSLVARAFGIDAVEVSENFAGNLKDLAFLIERGYVPTLGREMPIPGGQNLVRQYVFGINRHYYHPENQVYFLKHGADWNIGIHFLHDISWRYTRRG